MYKKVLFLLFFRAHMHALLLSLELAEELALAENPVYLIAKEKVYQSDQQKWLAFSGYLPKVSYQSFFAHTFSPTLVENIETGRFSYTNDLSMHRFELTQPFVSSELFFTIAAADLVSKIEREKQQQEKNALLFAVRRNYYAAVVAHLQVEVQKENVFYLRKALSIEKNRYDLGASPSLSVTKSSVASSNAVSLYYQALKESTLAKNALITSLGIESLFREKIALEDTTISFANIPFIERKITSAKQDFLPLEEAFLGSIDEDVLENKKSLFSADEMESYLQKALSCLPEIEAQRLAIEIEERSLQKTYSAYLPEVGGFVDYQKNAGDPASRVFSEDEFSFAAGVKISWNIFDSFGRERKIKKAASKKIAAKLRYKYALLEVKKQVQDTLQQIEDAVYQYLHATNAVSLAKKSMVQAEERLRIGRIRPLDFRDALNEWSQAKNLQNKAAYQLIIAYYQLVYLVEEVG